MFEKEFDKTWRLVSVKKKKPKVKLTREERQARRFEKRERELVSVAKALNQFPNHRETRESRVRLIQVDTAFLARNVFDIEFVEQQTREGEPLSPIREVISLRLIPLEGQGGRLEIYDELSRLAETRLIRSRDYEKIYTALELAEIGSVLFYTPVDEQVPVVIGIKRSEFVWDYYQDWLFSR